MIRHLIQGILLSYFLVMSGCTALNSFEDSLEDAGWAQFDRTSRLANPSGRVSLTVKRADGSWGLGAGAAVKGGHVLTVAHVIDGASGIEAEVSGRLVGVTAHVERRIPAVPEDLVELRLERSPGVLGFAGLGADDVLQTASGEPTLLWSSNGLFRLPCLSLPGDSGSPLLDDQGRLVGLHVGKVGDSPVWVSLPRVAHPSEKAPQQLIPLTPDDVLALGGNPVWQVPAAQAVRQTQAMRRG
jgi:S1-C subfamily serine protease